MRCFVLALVTAALSPFAWAEPCYLVDTGAQSVDPVTCPASPAPECSNGLDDDGDGYIDAADPGCTDGSELPDDSIQPPAPGGFSTYNAGANANDMQFVNGRWEIRVDADGTLWWNDSRGEAEIYSDAISPGNVAVVSGVFADLTPTDWAYNFGMVIVMRDDQNWEMAAVGNRPASSPQHVTVEHKRTIGDSSSQGDIGAIPLPQADLRITVLADGSLHWEYSIGSGWLPLDPISYAPRINCTDGCNVMIGAYAYGMKGLPFVGGAQSVSVQ